MYAQAVRIPPVHLRGKRIQSSAFAQCAKGCAFPDVQLDCIKYLKLGDPACGSCARGDYDDESDVDIMILLDVPQEEIPAERGKTVRISSKLDEEFDYDILFAPVVESKDVFMKYQNAMPFFSNVMKEGKVYV